MSALGETYDSDAVCIKGKLLAHLIVQDIILCAVLEIDSSVEVYGVADLSAVAAAPCVCAVFLNFLVDGRVGVLFVNYCIGI